MTHDSESTRLIKSSTPKKLGEWWSLYDSVKGGDKQKIRVAHHCKADDPSDT